LRAVFVISLWAEGDSYFKDFFVDLPAIPFSHLMYNGTMLHRSKKLLFKIYIIRFNKYMM